MPPLFKCKSMKEKINQTFSEGTENLSRRVTLLLEFRKTYTRKEGRAEEFVHPVTMVADRDNKKQ